MIATSMTNLENALAERSARRGLTVTLERARYAVDSFLGPVSSPQGTALFVGVGHGLDALIALQRGMFAEVVGVDPYVEADGNGLDDLRALRELVGQLGLESRFRVVQGTVQEYLAGECQSVDVVVLNDVLHHIFVTNDVLTRTALFDDAIALFEGLRARVCSNGMMAISDVERNGFRPWLTRHGLLPRRIDYGTKQACEEWDTAVRTAGWQRSDVRNYIPYPLRKWRSLGRGLIPRRTICDKYFAYYLANRRS